MNTELALNLAIRSFAPPFIALICLGVWRKSSASNRRMVWIMCFVVLAGLPLCLLKLPTSTIVRTAPAASPSRAIAEDGGDLLAALPAAGSHGAGAGVRRTTPLRALPAPVDPTFSTSNIVAERASYALALWALGVLLVVGHWLTGLIRLFRLKLEPVRQGRLIETLGGACHSIGIRSVPNLSLCDEATAPMVFGHFRPQVVLPADAVDWSDEAVRAVFLHECAHLRRGDWLGMMFSRLLCALYWFNPLAWIAARRLRDECEAAADDTVLLSGVSPGTYAGELLRIASNLSPKPIAGSLALLEVGPLRKRIARVLERNLSRGSTSPATIGAALALSVALSAALGFAYRVVEGQSPSRAGAISLGHGRHVRIIAIVRRTPTGTIAWNAHGEILPNSFPLLDGIDPGEHPSRDRRYIVFAHNAGTVRVEDSKGNGLGAQSMEVIGSTEPGFGYYVRRVDEDDLLVANFDSGGASSATVRCEVSAEPQARPLNNAVTSVDFPNIPMSPIDGRTATPELDVPVQPAPNDSNTPGALIGIADMAHPEWGYWRPDGTPLPRIDGVYLPPSGGRTRPVGDVTRRVGLLFRSREGSSDGVECGDASGVLIAASGDIFHTPRGQYELAEVFLNPGLASMQVIAKAPTADRVVSQFRLTPITPSKEITQFFSNRIARPVSIFGFDRKVALAGPGHNRSLRFLDEHDSTPPYDSLSTDWEDGAVAVNTRHPERIVAARLLEHGYEFYSYEKVALFPRGLRP